MIGPVSGTGRAMMASLQQAIQKGMPPDQAIQYVKSMATQGVAPLADLYAMMNQFQRLKQPQAQPPQTPPTIRDQLNMMDQAQRMQSGIAGVQNMPAEPMSRGLGAIDAGTMENPSFAGGGMVALAGGGDVDDGTVKMAAGTPPYVFNDELEGLVPSFMTADMDIVSFVKAQMPNFDRLSPEQKQQVLRQFEPTYMRARAAKQTLAERKAKVQPEALRGPTVSPAEADFARTNTVRSTSPFATPDEALSDTFSRLATRTGGESVVAQSEEKPAPPARSRAVTPTTSKGDVFTQYEMETPSLEKIRAEREERQKTAKTGAFSQADADLAAYIKEQKDQGGDSKEAYRNFWVMTGASLMANKSPNFLAALGESVKENYGGLVKDLKELKDSSKQLRLQEIQLRRAQEQATESGAREDQDRFDALSERARTTNFKILEARVNIEQKVLERNHEKSLATIRAGGDTDMANILAKQFIAAQQETDPVKKKAILDQYQSTLAAAGQITRATTAGGASADVREQLAVAEAIQALETKDSAYRNLARIYNNVSGNYSPDEVANAKAKMDRMVQERVQRTSAVLGLGPRVTQDQGLTGGAYTGPYSTSGWNQ